MDGLLTQRIARPVSRDWRYSIIYMELSQFSPQCQAILLSVGIFIADYSNIICFWSSDDVIISDILSSKVQPLTLLPKKERVVCHIWLSRIYTPKAGSSLFPRWSPGVIYAGVLLPRQLLVIAPSQLPGSTSLWALVSDKANRHCLGANQLTLRPHSPCPWC